jgi:hypothetical protein
LETLTVFFVLAVMQPGATPDVYQEEVESLETCFEMAEGALRQMRSRLRIGSLQASCVIAAPEPLEVQE